MNDIDNSIAKEKEKLKQLIAKKKEQELREQKKQNDLKLRRQTIIGQYFSEIIPSVLELNPCKTADENKAEFEPLIKFLSTLAENESLMNSLAKAINQKMLSENYPKNNGNCS